MNISRTSEGHMRRIRLYATQAEASGEIAELLDEADCGTLDAGEQPASQDGTEGDEDVFLVILTSELAEDKLLDEELRRAVANCSRIVGIWPRGASSGSAPASMKKYGFAQVPWNAEAVARVICGDATDRLTPKGEPEVVVETKRNTC